MKLKIFIISFLLILLSSCSSPQKYELNEEEIFRINSLYEHTLIMIDLSTEEQMEKLNIDVTKLKRNIIIIPEYKINLLEQAYNMDLENKKLDVKIELLENKMVELMENWE